MKTGIIKTICIVLACTLLFGSVVFADDSKSTDLIYIQKAKVLFVNSMTEITYEYEYEVGEKLIEPEHGVVSGYTFGGWYRDAACANAWNFEKDTVTNNITLYAKWIEDAVPKIAIGGNVTENNENVPDATVELFLGTVRVAATATDSNGQYSFNNVENGTYNIVVTKKVNGETKTKTELVTVNDKNATVDVVLPTAAVNSKVEHKGTKVAEAKSNISQTVVGGLDEIANNVTVSGTDKVTIKLTVEPKADTGTEAQKEIKTQAGSGKKVEFLDMSLLMQVNDEEPDDIGDKNTQLLTIVIPFDFNGVNVSSVMILRNHKGSTTKLTNTPNRDGEYFTLDKQAGTITIHAKYFSEYAIAYNEQAHSGGGGSSTKPTPVVPETGYVKCAKDSTCPLYKFTDLKTTGWYHDGIHFCLDEGLMKGISATKFDQAGNTSRAMMMTIVARMGGEKCDTVGANWYLDGVNYVIANKISDGSRPTDMITREEFAVMLYNFAKTQGKGFKGDWVFPLDFKDANKVSDDAYEAMCWCVMNKILNGRGGIYAGMLDPKGRLTRAEASAMIQRYYEVK